MTAIATYSPTKTRSPSDATWAHWRSAVLLILSVFLVRMAYLIWFCPYELLGDEAYYWEWSRHLDLCYYEKGPGLAWFIALSTRLFGSTDWAVRLPAALSSAIGAWAAGKLAMRASGGSRRAGLLAVVIFVLLPAYQANAQICTQDSPMIALWLLATLAGLRLVRRWRDGQTALADWLLLAGVLGIAFLFKQTALLFVPGLLLFWFLQRKQLPWHRRLGWNIATAALLFAVLMSPVIVWNAQHGWPTLAHTAGHAGMGGDKPGDFETRWTWLSMPTLVGAQLGGFGPPAIILMTVAVIRAIRSRKADSAQWTTNLWIICCSVPAIAFFVLLSVLSPVLGSWPFPSFGPLVALAGCLAATQFDAAAAAPATPESRGFRRAWRAVVIYGLAGWAFISFPNVLAHVPVVSGWVRGPLSRITGRRQAAAELAQIVERVRSEDGGRPPMIVARYYMTAAEYAFYLPGQPTVFCASAQLGKRPGSYDFWPQTDLTDPALLGRTAVLDGRGVFGWNEIMRFERLEEVGAERAFIGHGFQGLLPRPHHPKQDRKHAE